MGFLMEMDDDDIDLRLAWKAFLNHEVPLLVLEHEAMVVLHTRKV